MTLRDLTNIPDDQHGRLFAGMNQQIVNAMALKRFEGDAAHLTMQRCAGEVLFLALLNELYSQGYDLFTTWIYRNADSKVPE